MSRKVIFNRYFCNQIVLAISLSTLIFSFNFLLTKSSIQPLDVVIFIPLHFLCLHYLLNITHIASHNQMSRSFLLNKFLGNIAAIFGGLTLADFTATHLVHHLNPADKNKDPDYPITKLKSGKTNFLSIPFKIWMHDMYFWQSNLWKKRNAWVGYLINRIAQIAMVVAFSLSGNINIWSWFWLLPVLLVGYFNGMFLFYFPHFTTNWENAARRNLITHKSIGIISSVCLKLIDISRIYHEFHHNNITENTNYYPLESYIWKSMYGNWVDVESNFKGKYVHS